MIKSSGIRLSTIFSVVNEEVMLFLLLRIECCRHRADVGYVIEIDACVRLHHKPESDNCQLNYTSPAASTIVSPNKIVTREDTSGGKPRKCCLSDATCYF